MTWKYIDDEEHRVDVNEATFDKEHKTNSEVRFILYQDQINFVKYFVNLKIIPIYNYFDSFMDSFCMLASKIVDDQNYEVVQSDGDNSRSEGIYTSVDVLNYKAFYKLLESAINPNETQKLEKERSDRMETEKQNRIVKVEKKYDDGEDKKKQVKGEGSKPQLESLQTSAKGKFDELKVRLLLDRLPRVVNLSEDAYSLPLSTTPSGTPSVSRVPSAESTDEEAGSDTLSRTSSIVLSRYGSGETKNTEESALMFEIQNAIYDYLDEKPDEIKNIINDKHYEIDSFKGHMDIVRVVASHMNRVRNMSKDADLAGIEVKHDKRWVPDDFSKRNNLVATNTIKTYNDGNCFYYAIILSAWYQNEPGSDNGTKKIIYDNFGKGCVDRFIEEDNFELIQLKKERGESAEKDANVAPKVKEIEDRTDECINTFKNSLIEWYTNDKAGAIGFVDESESYLTTLFDEEIKRVKDSIKSKMNNFADAFLSRILARFLGINIRILSPSDEQNPMRWVSNVYRSITPDDSETVTVIYDALKKHFDATSIQN